MNIEIEGLSLIKQYMALNDLGIILSFLAASLFLGGCISALCVNERVGVYISLGVAALGIVLGLWVANSMVTVPHYVYVPTGLVDMNHIQLSWYIKDINRNLITMIPIEFSPV